MLNALMVFMALMVSIQLSAQIRIPGISKPKTGYDSIPVEAGKLVLFPDTLFIPDQDTLFVVPVGTRVKIKENPAVQSESFYDSLESKSDRSLITRKLHSLLFRSSAVELTDSTRLVRSEAPFEPYRGYRIADIRISNAEFLGGQITDTSTVAKSLAARTINALHANTKEAIVIRNLFVEIGDIVDPYQLADNERILRDLPYIRDARIMLVPRPDEESAVDLYIITQDRLSLFIDGDFDGFDDFTLEIGSRNILGTGNQFSVAYQYAQDESPQSGYELKLIDFNVRGSFIRSELTYSNRWDRKGYEASFQRAFLTPLMKWGGGFDFGNLEQIRMVDEETDSIIVETDSLRIPYKQNFQDFWLGRSFVIGSTSDRMNITISSRITREEFTERPFVASDSNYFFHDGVLWLNQLELTKRKFLKSTMIQAFGITEDIPIGYQFRMIGGYEFGEFIDRPYVGVGIGAGDFWKKWGYFSANAEIGGFVEDQKFEEGVVAVEGLYFSPLLKFHRNHFRQFVRLEYSALLRPVLEEPFGFGDNIRGISGEIQGDRKLGISIESVLFHPLKIYGFRLATYAFYDFGWITFDDTLIRGDNFHSAVGIGFRLRNESLLFRTIQFRFGIITDDGFDFNFSFSNPRIFSEFSNDKPQVVEFR